MKMCRAAMIALPFVLIWGTSRATAQSDQGAQETQQSDDNIQPLHYADESTPKNNLVVDLNGATAYDDNVFSDNAKRVGGTLLQAGAHLGLDEERERSALSIDYLPEFLFYTNVNGYNQVNQSLRFGARYALSRRLQLRFQDSGNYFTGIPSPRLNENASPEAESSPSLNNTVFFPLARHFSNEGRVDATYQMSRRSSFDFFGSAGTRNFSGTETSQGSLLNTQVFSGGVAYNYRLTASSTVGISAMHQNVRFGPSMDEIESTVLTYSWQGKSGFMASLYGGPEYVRLNEDLGSSIILPGSPLSLGIHDREHSWDGSFGANVGWRSPRTNIHASAQRVVSDGGGLFASVTNSSVDLDVRRHLFRYWDLLATVMIAQSKALAPVLGGAGLDDQSGSLKIERQLGNNLVAQIGYEAARQRVTGTYPFLVDMNRNYVSLGFFYRFEQIPLGR